MAMGYDDDEIDAIVNESNSNSDSSSASVKDCAEASNSSVEETVKAWNTALADSKNTNK